MHDPQIRPAVPEITGHEREVVVLHEHDVAVRRGLDDAIGERTVDGDVGVPRLPETLVETWTARQVEQSVVEEPQRRVRHDVVVESVLAGIESEQLDADIGERGRALGRRRPVVVGHGGGHPTDRFVRAPAQQPPECSGQPTGAATSPERAVLGAGERRRPPMGDDDHPRSSVSRRSQSSSSRVDRKFARTCSLPCVPIASAPTGSASRSTVRAAHSSTEPTR